MIFFGEDFGNVASFANGMGILGVDIDNYYQNNFQEDHPDTTIHVRLLAWPNQSKKREALQKDTGEESMPVAWHPKNIVGLMHFRK